MLLPMPVLCYGAWTECTGCNVINVSMEKCTSDKSMVERSNTRSQGQQSCRKSGEDRLESSRSALTVLFMTPLTF